MKEAVTTLPGSLGVNPYQWTPAHRDVPPEWLDQVDHPCMIGGRHGTMQIVNGKLVCVVTPKESTKMIVSEVMSAASLKLRDDIHAIVDKVHPTTSFDFVSRRIHDVTKNWSSAHRNTVLNVAMRRHSANREKYNKEHPSKESQMKPLAFAQSAVNSLIEAAGKNLLLQGKESMGMNDDDVITESVTLRFSSPSRTQLAKVANYFSIGRATGGLGKIIIRPIEGVMGNWSFELSSNDDNQFLDPSRMNGIIPAEVTVTRSTGGPISTTQVASQDETRNIIREMIQEALTAPGIDEDITAIYHKAEKGREKNAIETLRNPVRGQYLHGLSTHDAEKILSDKGYQPHQIEKLKRKAK
jgi:hypothetical protein